MIKGMRLETNKLIIRPYKEDDFLECYQLMQDKELFRYMNMDIMSLDEYKKLFNWLICSYNKGFFDDFKYSFNITFKESGTHIGWCGIGGLEFDHERKEIFYLIGKNYWGKGYAKEATKALLAYGYNTIGLETIAAVVNPSNIASIKVVENMGLNYQYIIEGLPEEFSFYNGLLYYLLNKDEFLKRQESK